MKGWPLPAKFAAHVRPGTDFMREALFNGLQHTFGIEDTEVLDLFSGSGIMSLEFLSRGAARVIAVDRDEKNIRHQQAMGRDKQLQSWTILKSDVFRFLEKTEESFDFIFADPPYDMPGIQELATLAVTRLKPGGIFMLEHRPGILFPVVPDETRKYGSTAVSFFSQKA